MGRALVQRDDAGAPAPALGIIPADPATVSRAIWAFRSIPRRRSSTRCARQPRVVDAGELGDHMFFNVAGIGLDAHVAALVTTRIHHRGLMPYLSASAGDLLRYQPVGIHDRDRWPDDPNVRDRSRVRELDAMGIRRAHCPRRRSERRIARFRRRSGSRIHREHAAGSVALHRRIDRQKRHRYAPRSRGRRFDRATRCCFTSMGKRCRDRTRSSRACIPGRCGCGRRSLAKNCRNS